MAIRTFNSVAGFSVGEVPTTIVTSTGNVTTGNLLTNNLLYANGQPWDFVTASGSSNYIQFSDGADLSSNVNLQFDNANANLNVIGNINVGSASNVKIYANGTINASSFNGSFSGNIANIGSNLNIIYNYNGNLGSSTSLQYDPSVNTFYGSNVVSANYFKGTFDSLSNSQPNITSLGNLTGLQIGNVSTIGNVNITTNGDVNATGNLNATGDISANNAVFTGNLTVSGTTTFVNTTNTSIKDPLLTLGGNATGGNISAADNKDRGLILDNFYSGAPVNQGLIWKTSTSQFEVGSNVEVTDNVVTIRDYGNIKALTFKGNVDATNIIGTISSTSSSQPNITSLGTLTGVDVNGLANVAQLTVGEVVYPNTAGGDGQYLRTYANGEVYYGSLDTSKVANGTTEIDLLNSGNIEFKVAGTTNTVVFTTDGANVTGNANVSGNVNVINSLNANVANVTSVVIGNSSILSTTVTTVSTGTATLVSIPTSSFRGAEFMIKGENSTGGKYSIATILAVHDSASPAGVDFTSYGLVSLGGQTGTFNVTSDTSNVYLKVSPSDAASTVWTTQYRII
jgi:hypothetical protein